MFFFFNVKREINVVGAQESAIVPYFLFICNVRII